MADGVGTTVTGVGTGITTTDGDRIHTTTVAGAGTVAGDTGTIGTRITGVVAGAGITGIIGTSGDLERGFGPFLGFSARGVSDQA